MNTNIIKGNGRIIWGKAQQKFASITGNKLLYLNGKKDEFLGKGERGYGKIQNFVDHSANWSWRK
ncbi:MAG: hypothetical protein JWO06_3497 [Bacteroidota bacterium]|nr:hypothetical protein [Bacteroidota bacterium]